MKFIVAYDIENTKNRTKLFEKLKDFGLISVQKSVFYGELLKPEIPVIKSFFAKFCGTNDCAFIAPCELQFDLAHGYSRDMFEFEEILVL